MPDIHKATFKSDRQAGLKREQHLRNNSNNLYLRARLIWVVTTTNQEQVCVCLGNVMPEIFQYWCQYKVLAQ